MTDIYDQDNFLYDTVDYRDEGITEGGKKDTSRGKGREK